uniref:trypsin-like peptidase domain-containing protein n=1 Tax=Candidatus Electrothrix sp. TaxID=2170559 RepID=UPI0040567653
MIPEFALIHKVRAGSNKPINGINLISAFKTMIKRLPLLCLLALCCTASQVPAHQLYLKNGRIISTNNVWREGDRVHYEQYGGTISIPYSKVKGVTYEARKKEEQAKEEPAVPLEKNLAAQLNKVLAPQTPVEQASLSTLSIKTPTGFGSGFFISADGHIITNKHVVRGSKKQQKKIETNIEQGRKNLQQYKRALDNAAQHYASYKNNLQQDQALLRKLQRSGKVNKASLARQQEKLRAAEQDLLKEEKRLAKARKKYQSEKKSFDKDVEEFHRAQEGLAGQNNFKIILADETELYASLFRTSDKHDLALLKITGYKTPFLQPILEKELTQGQQVFAVGSPADLSLKNTVTSGILSAFRANFIQTNAQIYPGNSGGPLIDNKGRVMGVNTKKLLTQKFEGLGFAIPIRIVFAEFKDYLLSN